MKHASLTQLRRNLASMLNAVNNDHEPLVVSRRRGKPVVVMSLEDFEAMGKAAAGVTPEAIPPAPVRAATPRHVNPAALHPVLRSFGEVDEITFVPKLPVAPERADRT